MRSSLSGTDGGVIYEYDETRKSFILRASHQMEEELVDALACQLRPRLGDGVVGRAAASRDAGASSRYSGGAGIYAHAHAPVAGPASVIRA